MCAVLLGCLGCAGEEESRVELLPYEIYCFGFDSVHPCHASRDRRTYDDIHGFEFKWGYATVATIETTHLDDPPADGSSIVYSLVDIESRTPVQPGTRFELALPRTLDPEDVESIVAGDCADGFELFRGFPEAKPFSVESAAGCESFEQQLANELPLALSFEFGSPEVPLRLVAFE
jgi:hypothetical protein